MSTKHTPGPWRLAPQTGVPRGTEAILGKRGLNPASTIATVYRTHESEGAANAELILNAPAMAAEIRRLRRVNEVLLDACVTTVFQCHANRPPSERFALIEEVVTEALALAEQPADP